VIRLRWGKVAMLHAYLDTQVLTESMRHMAVSGIAEATAKHHAHAVYAAFGVSSRADFILTANRRGVGAG